MRQFVPLVLLLIAGNAWADKVTLTLPSNGKISFDAPATSKLKETIEAGRYQYVASSAGKADERFAVSVTVEPAIDCHHGKATKDITRCFLEKTDDMQGIVRESRRTECADKSCTVVYMLAYRDGDKDVRQLQVNVLFAYRKGWGRVLTSVDVPTEQDVINLMAFPSSLSYKE
ncbi:MAG TPA: hypothetical protein VK629_09130 [Steroidobacteraceae bacterium]|nr:hypothetical protein [Steroidobacteraceae bacterium]